MTLAIIALILLFAPLAFELWNDRNGEAKSEKGIDVLLRVLIAILAATIGFLITDKSILQGVILSLAIHFFVFDYAINYILIRRGVVETKATWFSHLGKSYTDDVLRQFSPPIRFIIKLVVLILSTLMYIL